MIRRPPRSTRVRSSAASDVYKRQGVLSVLPVTGVLLMVGFLAITGMPPFGIFLTEIYILSAGVAANLPVVIVVLFLLLLVFAGFLRHMVSMLFSSDAPPEPVGESNYLTIVPPVLLLLLFVAAGFYLPAQIRTLIDSAASLING